MIGKPSCQLLVMDSLRRLQLKHARIAASRKFLHPARRRCKRALPKPWKSRCAQHASDTNTFIHHDAQRRENFTRTRS